MVKEKSENSPHWALMGALRFYLALIVALHHVAQSTNDGTLGYYRQFGPQLAVMLFLVISGFSIHSSYARESEGFFKRRFWRVAPVYWTGCLLALMPFWVFGLYLSVDFQSALAQPTLGEAIRQFLFLQPGFGPAPDSNAALWTLGVEVAFYALAPLLFRLSARYLAALIAASIVSSFYLPVTVFSDTNLANYPNVFWGFGLGWLFYSYRSCTLTRAIVALTPFLVVGAGVLIHGSSDRFALPVALIGGMIIAFGSHIQITPRLARWCHYLGDLSYPLYAVHWPVAWFISFLYLDLQTPTVMLPVLAVSALVLHLIDRPLRKRGRSKTTRNPLAAPRLDFSRGEV